MRHHNTDYSAGIPVAVGDRYYAQDIFRDWTFLRSRIGEMDRQQYGLSTLFIKEGGLVSQGAGHTLNITACKAIVPFTITKPHETNAWAMPPTTDTEDLNVTVELPAQTNWALSGTTNDGTTTNYLKLSYAETDGNTRARAKKAGSYAYERVPSYTLTATAVAPTAYEVCLATFTTNGTTVTFTYNTSNSRRSETRFGAMRWVSTQEEWNNCIEFVSAGVYKFKDAITAIYVLNKGSNYIFAGTGGVSTGAGSLQLLTNNCKSLIFESGARLQSGDQNSYLNINTTEFYGENIYIYHAASAGQNGTLNSFSITAQNVRLVGCSVEGRKINSNATTSYSAFSANSTTNGYSARLDRCRVLGVTNGAAAANGMSFYGFINLGNLSHCEVISCSVPTSAAPLIAYGFYQCINMTSCTVNGINLYSGTAGTCQGIAECQRVTNCRVTAIANISASGITCYGIYNCTEVSNCLVDTISINLSFTAYNGSKEISGCRADNITQLTTQGLVAFSNCEKITGCRVNGLHQTSANLVYGYNACTEITACEVNDIDTTSSGLVAGFYACNSVSGCRVNDAVSAGIGGAIGYSGCLEVSSSRARTISSTTGVASGFSNCEQVSSCYANAISSGSGIAYGYYQCYYVSATKALNITSTSNRAVGYYDCRDIVSCNANTISGASTLIGNAVSAFANVLGVSACNGSAVTNTAGAGSFAIGMDSCSRISSSSVSSITAAGGTVYSYAGCLYISASQRGGIATNTCNNVDTNAGPANLYSCDAGPW